MSFPRYPKDPDSTLEYSVDWERWLDTDTIVTSSWSAATVSSGSETVVSLLKAGTSNTTKVATVWLTGGKVDVVYAITNTITTTAGRTDQRTIEIVVRQR